MASNLNTTKKCKCIYLISNEYCKLKTLQDKFKYGYGYLTENICDFKHCNDLTTKFNIIKRIKNYFKVRRK